MSQRSLITKKNNLVQQLVSPVNWVGTMKYFEKAGIDTLIELGPKKVLKRLAMKADEGIDAYAFDIETDQKIIMELKEEDFALDKQAKIRFMTRCMAIAVCTRNRNWDNTEYDEQFAKPYKKVSQLVEELEANDADPTWEQMKEAFEMLVKNFEAKKTSEEEKNARIEQLLNETGTRKYKDKLIG